MIFEIGKEYKHFTGEQDLVIDNVEVDEYFDTWFNISIEHCSKGTSTKTLDARSLKAELVNYKEYE